MRNAYLSRDFRLGLRLSLGRSLASWLSGGLLNLLDLWRQDGFFRHRDVLHNRTFLFLRDKILCNLGLLSLLHFVLCSLTWRDWIGRLLHEVGQERVLS